MQWAVRRWNGKSVVKIADRQRDRFLSNRIYPVTLFDALELRLLFERNAVEEIYCLKESFLTLRIFQKLKQMENL